jgi:predicted nuclease of predicted toxin-antitoxin system
MKFKLDENFGNRTQKLIRNFGHDVSTVREESIHGCSDRCIFDVCRHEHRCLITLDLDFSDITRFPPEQTNGIVVIRVPQNPSIVLLEQLLRQFLQMLEIEILDKKLWIVEVGRIRIQHSE